MKINIKSIIYFTLSFIAFLFTGMFCYTTKLDLALIASFITLFCTYKIFKISVKHLNSFTLFFLLFYTLYTYSAVLTVFFDVDGRKLFTESTPESACAYLFVSTLGLVGMSIPYLLEIKQISIDKSLFFIKKNQFTVFALFFLAVAFIGEMTNIFRAGGFEILKYGKGFYQSKTGDILITIPSALLLKIGYFFLGLRMFLSYELNYLKVFKNKLFITAVTISLPLIIIYLSVGFRGHLLGVIIAYLIGYSYFICIDKIKPKIVLFIFLGYSSMAILYGVRGQLKHLFTSGNWERFNYYVFQEKSYLVYFNPAHNEFGAPYMNYIKFYNDKDNTLLYGESYLSGLLIPIPRFLFPFEKPLAITYKFRDKYFNSWKKSSRVAGSGFSYVMEAQWNFGLIGPFIVYFLSGCFFWLLEYFRNKKKFMLFFPLFYAIFFPFAQSIHRSSFGFLMANVIVVTILLLALVLIKLILPFKTSSEA